MPNVETFAPPIPAAVKAAGKRASELQENFIKSVTPEGNEPPAEAPAEPPAETPAEPPAEVVAETPAAPAEPAEPPENDDSWKHKFLSMQGRYNSEVPKLKAQMQQMSGEITNLNRLLATVKPTAPAPSPVEQPKSLLTPEEIAEYGPEFVDIVSRITKQATAPYEKEISELKGQLKQVDSQLGDNARAQLMRSLAAEVPNWAEINTSQPFLDWLALPDTYSGAIRHEMLRSAFGRNDSTRVINFFKGFLAETAATAPAEQEPGTQAPTPKTPLVNFAAPGRAKSTAAPSSAPAEKPFFTASFIQKFYSDKALGKYRGREAEAKLLESQIFTAQQEGRIR